MVAKIPAQDCSWMYGPNSSMIKFKNEKVEMPAAILKVNSKLKIKNYFFKIYV
jgi:hypothetical protein